jgi:hypothetical protein
VNALALTLLLFLGKEPGISFEDPALWPIRIEIADSDLAKLRTEPRNAVPAKVQLQNFGQIAATVRLKGRGTFQSVDQKPSFTIDFARSPETGLNLSRIHLNNSAEDTSLLKEKIGSEIFREIGVPAPAVGHARVSLNARELGLYVLKEGFTTEFLERSFGSPAGNLYDDDLGSEVSERMDLDVGKANTSPLHLQQLARTAAASDHGKRLQQLESVLDLDQFIKFIAAEVLICHWDGYMLSQNNFRMYQPAQGKGVVFLPAGMDQIFSKPDFPWDPRPGASLAVSVLETKRGQIGYEETFRSLLQSFDAVDLSNRVIQARERLRPWLSRIEYNQISQASSELATNIIERKESLVHQLKANTSRFIEFTNGTATLSFWNAVNHTGKARLSADEESLSIEAGDRGSASWRTRMKLPLGRYRISTRVTTHNVIPLAGGRAEGASLRIVGMDANSRTLTGTTNSILELEFQVARDEDLTLACELRAAGGRASFQRPIRLQNITRN